MDVSSTTQGILRVRDRSQEIGSLAGVVFARHTTVAADTITPYSTVFQHIQRMNGDAGTHESDVPVSIVFPVLKIFFCLQKELFRAVARVGLSLRRPVAIYIVYASVNF